MHPQTQYYYENIIKSKSETYLKLESLSNDIRQSYLHDCDKTDSIKEIIQIIDGMLIMSSLEDYFSNNKKDLQYFMDEFSKDVISNILIQPIVYGENGDDIALDLLYHFVKLFMKFHNNKEYAHLFEKIRKIFANENDSFFNTKERYYKKELNPKKEYTYEQFNEEFCQNFKKDKKSLEPFGIGDKVDILISKNCSISLDKEAWVRGIIIDIIDNMYKVEYPNKFGCLNYKFYPIDSPDVLKEGTKTDDWDWRISLQKNDVIDCFDRGKWFPSTICDVQEKKTENDLIYKEYRVGFRLYPEHFLEKNDYDTFIQYYVFWDNNNNNNDNIDKDGNSFYGDEERMDENISFYSKRIQKFQKFTSIQRESLNNQMNNILNSYNNSLNMSNNNGLYSLAQNSNSDERLKIMTEYLENDKSSKSIDELYFYEKDGHKNYIIGKDNEKFSYYFAKLLKIMADNGNFEEMIKILKEKPTVEEIYNIFYILMNCIPFIHIDFYKENYNIFKNAFFYMMDNLSSKEMRSLQKEVKELANNFLMKINYELSPNKKMSKEFLDDIYLTLSFKMIKSSIFDKKIQGLKTLGEYIKTSRDKDGKKNMIDLIKKNEVIKEIFGTNYHTQIISKSIDILELMLDNNEITEDEIKLIWSLTEQGDLEAKRIIIKLFSDLIPHLNENYCNYILDCINKEKDKQLDDTEIELIYNLSIKGKNENYMLKSCEYYCKNALEINNLNNLQKSPFIEKVVNLFSKAEKYSFIVIDSCENNLKANKNVLAAFYVLEKIIERYKKNIKINSEDDDNGNNNNNDFINKSIHKLIDNDKLLNLFKNNFLLYKKTAKESIKENKHQKNLIIEGYTHEDNMKNRVMFLIKIIPMLYPKLDFFELLKEICIHEPVYESDKYVFYDFMKKYISDNNSNSEPNTKEQKIAIQTQLFNMLTNENKTEMTPTQFNLYIEIFLNINSTKELLSFKNNAIDDFTITINNNVNIDDIFGIDKLWDLLFELNKEHLTQKVINIIYNLYKNKEETQKLLDKCVNIIKDVDNITYMKLEKCMNILKFIIIESEKNGFIEIKPHIRLLKDCIINIPIEIKKKKKDHNVIFTINDYKKNSSEKDLYFGNTTLVELKQIIIEKNNLDKNNIEISLSSKENNSTKSRDLDLSVNNKTLTKILNIDNNDINYDKNRKQKLVNSSKIIFTGDKIERQPLVKLNRLNNKFEKMLKEWFNYFSNGNEIMDKDDIMRFISLITSNDHVDEKNEDYIKFMNYDNGQKNFILEEEFIQYYNDLALKNQDKVWEHIKIMKYREDFKKDLEPSSSSNTNEKIDNKKLPRYILGNDKQFHDALIQLFMKFDKKLPIYKFLFFLCTNENEYEQLLNNYNILFNDDNNNINYLDILYKLIIIESFIQDLEVTKLDLNQIFKNKNNNNKAIFNQKETTFQIASKKYLPFDDVNNLSKKKSFLMNFIENGGYEKLINYIEHLLDCINNIIDDEQIEIKCCQKALKLINIIYNSFLEKNLPKENNNKIDIFFLNNNIDINSIIKLENEKDDKNNDNNKLKEKILNTSYVNLVKKIISFLMKFQYCFTQTLPEPCFNLLIELITTNELLSNEITKNDDIKNSFSTLIKNNINSPFKDGKFFIQSLNKYINNLSNNKKSLNKLDIEFLRFLFDISNSLFKNILKNNDNSINNIISYSVFYEFLSNLLKVIMNKNYNINTDFSNEFIFELYELLYKDITEENKDKKLSEDTFLGFMKILITAIKNNQLIKREILNKKINDETLFEIIYDKIMPQNKKNNNSQIEDDYFNIRNLVYQINDENIDFKFIQIKKCDDINQNYNIKNKKKKEDNISQDIYDIFNNFILACLSDSIEPEYIKKLLKIISYKKKKSYSSENSKKQKFQKSCGHVGLKNNGCICYMNSILQQMYMVPTFRYAILSADDNKIHNSQLSVFNNNMFDDNLLHQIQRMYTFLTYSEKQAYNPKDFCSSFKDFDGTPINPLLQQDSQEFFNNFCDKIENSLKNTKFKYIIDNIFTGKTCSSVICEKCNTVSNRFEDFYNLTLEVKNFGSLYESLEKMIVPEKIEQFNCEVCKQKVTISKRTSLAKLPNVLFVHLKRFYMNYENGLTEKINSKFEFPNTLNLKKFCIEEINKNKNNNSYETDEIYPKEEDYYEYELKGINIHLGNAQGGHYVSFIDVERDGHNNELDIKSSIENNVIKSKWLKFNDSIVTQFDTKDIPSESFGGYVDNNLNNENIQSAYLLIYERKRKTPIKIIVNKESVKSLNEQDKDAKDKPNNIITFSKEKRAYINKLYDITYTKKDNRIKNEEELYKLIFCEEETNECYVYIPYYNIDKIVLKENFIEVMNKNKKFFKNKDMLYENIKIKDECNDILFNIINLKGFNILNEEFSLDNKKQLIKFFKEQIFDNNIFKNNSLIIEDEEKIIINDKTNILLNNIILPITKSENNEENDELIDQIRIILLCNANLKKIFETKKISRVFDNRNVKIFFDIISSLLSYLNLTINIKPYFNNIIKLKEEMNEDSFIFFSNEENKEEDKITYPLYYLYELIYRLLQMNTDFIETMISQQQISNLIGKINQINSLEIRNIIYNILLYIIDHCYDYTRVKNGDNSMNYSEKLNLKQLLKNKLFKQLLEENVELLIKLVIILQYNDSDYSEEFNKNNIQFLFNFAIKNQKLTQILDLLFEIINIKDQYTLDRLYYIMGFPDIIIYQQKDNDKKDDDVDSDSENDEEKNEEQNKISENKKNKFWPLIGCGLLRESKNGEIYKYVNNIKIYETHCILAQLFPCSSDGLYANLDFIENEQKLTDEERNKYIYKLLSISLLNEGNYCLFKYIYLTQSRFAAKYNNLYEEIIDILSKENKYDLTEIKQNADICIKRINFETNRLKSNLSKITNKKLDSEDEIDKKENNSEGIKNDDNYNNEIPELPEKMKKKYIETEDIDEFIGFTPTHIQDTIVASVYKKKSEGQDAILLQVKYYSTFKNIKSIRNKEKEKEKDKDKENKTGKDNNNNDVDDLNKIEENEDKKDNISENNSDNDDGMDSDKEIFNDDFDNIYSDNTFNVNQIKITEDSFLKKIYEHLKRKKKIIIKDKSFKNKKNVKLSLIRYILYNKSLDKIMTKIISLDNNNKMSNIIKFNCYIPSFSINYIKALNYTDIIKIYRKNKMLDFIKDDSFSIHINISSKESFKNDNYFKWPDRN